MEKELRVQYCDDPEECARFLGEKISLHIQNRNDQPLLLMLSGGSAFSVLPFIVAESFDGVTVSMLDERFEQGVNNNFTQLEKIKWYQGVCENGGAFISTKVQVGDTKEMMADRFEKELRSWREENPEGQMIALFGMGVDGHTAGIFPYPEDPALYKKLFESERLVVAYDAEGKNEFPERITTTHTLHRKIAHAFVYIMGEEKRRSLEALISHPLPQNALPATIFYAMPDVIIGTTIRL
jgi:6-phosphogluconolactonase/glucosamine-6-phosphate isomerase/deaminase